MKLKLLVLMLFAASSVFAQQGTKKSPKKRKHKSALKTAKEHLRFEEFQEAMPYVQELLEGDPNSAYYNFWMGKCLYITYKKNQALPYFDKVEKINPDVDREFHYWYGLTLHYNLHFERAIGEYRRDLERYEPGTAEYVWVNNRISQCLYAQKISKKKEVEQVKIENMGEVINTPYAEHSPVISANDSVLLYTARRPESLGADPEAYFYDEDVYISHKRNGEWTEGVNIGRPVNGTGHDATISLTADGKTLYLYRHKKAGGLYVTEFDEDGQKWKEPHAVQKPLNSKYYEASICQSADSSMMFFTSDRPGGYGGRDIYVVRKDEKDKWGDPENLGPAINTAFDEDAPYFHPDGKSLYFSSNGPGSMGGFDIFVTELEEGTENSWLPPLNMGTPVNTPDDDIYFVLTEDGRSGYYSSGMEGGYGEKDIYHIKFPHYPYPRRYHIVELAGLVQDVKTLDKVPAMVRLVDQETDEVLDSVFTGSDMGKYYFMLEPERTYSLEVSASGYESTTAELSTPTLVDEDIVLEKNLFMDKPETPVVAETPMNLPEIQNIYYDFDKDNIRPDATRELDMVAEFLQQNQDLDLQILAHTDWFGTYSYNVDLSLRRANKAMNYLVSQKGIDPGRIETDFFSENRPMEANVDDRSRQFNRRSEFRFVKDGQVALTSVKLRTGVESIAVDHTKPKGLPGFDNPDGLVVMGGGPETAAPSTVPDGSPTAPLGKNVIKDRDGAPMGKDAVKAGLAENSSSKDAVKDRNTATTASADDALATAAAALDLHHIYFDFDKYNLRASAKAELDKLLGILAQFPDLQIEIYGHTDAFGSVDYNQQLSLNRSAAATAYLLAHNVSETQIVKRGFSENQPISSNDSEYGRQNNRRVEFRLLKDGMPILESEK